MPTAYQTCQPESIRGVVDTSSTDSRATDKRETSFHSGSQHRAPHDRTVLWPATPLCQLWVVELKQSERLARRTTGSSWSSADEGHYRGEVRGEWEANRQMRKSDEVLTHTNCLMAQPATKPQSQFAAQRAGCCQNLESFTTQNPKLPARLIASLESTSTRQFTAARPTVSIKPPLWLGICS